MTFRSLIAAAVLTATGACGALAQTAPLNPPVTIRINSAGLANEAGLFIAYDKGYFTEEGLKIDLIKAAATNSSSDLLTQLALGELDIASTGMSAALFNALNRGVEVTGIFAPNVIAKGDKSTGIVVRKDLVDSGRYKSPADFKGMKFATLTIGGSGHYNILRAAELGGLKADDIQLTTLSFPDTVVALANKSIDAAALAEPFVSTAAAQGSAVMVVPAGEISAGLPSIAMFVNGKFAAQHKEAVNRFVTALLRGQRDWRKAVTTGEGRDAFFQALMNHTAVKDRARLEKLNFAIADPNGGYDPEALDRLQKFFIAQNVQQKMMDSRTFFDRSYVDYALKRLGRVN